MQVQKRIEPVDPPRDVSCGKVFETTFIKDCFDFVFGAPINFLARGESRNVTVEKFSKIASTLLTAIDPGFPPGAVPADPVVKALADFLALRPWPPTGGSTGPAGFTSLRSKTVQHLEVAEILERLLERVNEGSGPGGGPSDWPPHIRP